MNATPSKTPARRGFTLVELLVCVMILAVLFSLTAAGLGIATAYARKARELTAAKNLITAYSSYTSDHDGRLMPGMDMRNKVVVDGLGDPVLPKHVGDRYVYRLAPYFNYQIEGTILVNDNIDQVYKMAPPGTGMHEYMVSAFPAFGINHYFTGGMVNAKGSVQWPRECVTKTSQLTHPLLVFASSGTGDGVTEVDGYNILTPPHLTAPIWSNLAWSDDTRPNIYGNVDARHNGKAVCAFTDGSVHMLTIKELRNMRLWSKRAADQGNEDYLIGN